MIYVNTALRKLSPFSANFALKKSRMSEILNCFTLCIVSDIG